MKILRMAAAAALVWSATTAHGDVALVGNADYRNRQKTGLAEVRALLGNAGATERAAATIAAALKKYP